jgi:polyisoprenyl-phosphate glycosyltransferase
MSRLISLVIPSCNEEKNIPLIYEKIKGVFSSLPEFGYEMIFVDDGSADGTALAVERLESADHNVRLVEFSRNFGKGAATSAGLDLATGEAVIMIDADLQHPPELIPEMIAKWRSGADVVVGIRDKNKGEGLVKRIGSAVFYRIMSRIGETKITPRATDFRLLDRSVVNEFNKFKEKDRMTRGLVDWLGFRRVYVHFAANERVNGKPAYGKLKLVRLAMSAFVAHSLFPLRIVGYLGLFITAAFGLFGAYLLFGLVFNDPFAKSFSGTAQLAILIAFFIGIILSSLGLVALYIAQIRNEILGRPLYIIRKKRNQ